MATPALTPSRIASTRCPVHHQPAALCGSPEIADALDAIRALRLDVQLVTEHAFLLDVCGGCPDRDGDPETAVVRVGYTTRGGVRYHTDTCPLCLDAIVRDHRAHAVDVRAYLPVPAGAFGTTGAVA